MADKRAIKVETLDRLGASFQESRGITDKLTIEQMIELAKVPTASGENKLAQLVDGTLTELTAEDLRGATKIRANAFDTIPITAIEFPETVTSIEKYAFCRSSLVNVTIPDTITISGTYAFAQIKTLKTFRFGKGIKYFPNDTFYQSGTLDELYYDGDLTDWLNIEFGNSLGNPLYQTGFNTKVYFKNASGEYELLEGELLIPEVITEIKPNVLCGARSIKSLIIHDNVTTIGAYAFSHCYACENVIVGRGVTSIGSSAFGFGSSTTGVKATITFLGTTPPTIQSSYWGNISKIIVPKGCGEAYKTATNWANLANYIEEATE